VSERNVQIVRDLYGAFDEIGMDAVRDALAEGGDIEATATVIGRLGELSLELTDPDVEVDLTASQVVSLPDGTRFRGLEGWLVFWRGWFEPWEDFKTRVLSYTAHGEHVMLDVVITARGRGSGVPVELRQTQVWTLRDGRVVRLSVFDTREEALASIDDGEEAGSAGGAGSQS
jgi:ketosteroid isomerase-like protein